MEAVQTPTPTAYKSLTQAQVDSFWTHGFLSIGKILTDDELELFRREYDYEFDRARAGETSFRNLAINQTDDLATKNKAEKQLLQIMQMCDRNIHFRQLTYHERILDIIEDLIGPNIQLFHDQAIYKPAYHGGPVFWHQDNAYWRCSPPNLVSCWLTLDDVNVDNGAMQFIPGTHFQAVEHGRAKAVDALLDLGDQADAVPPTVVDLPAGGIAIHHCQTLHHTAPNTTARQRRALAIHYMVPGTRSLRTGDYLGVSFSRPMLRMRV
ncbi:MAG: phytanoyl-CoA dioxygenase family protein [Caldilineaceae bacterium]|nr:phytanoyl-CoA dioxygenase family protein [Caldilineaceae bacterium]